jgi:serine phosphatase RsbU (regulator of sigma subunit)
LYTDGVIEAENAAEVSFGTGRLKEIMDTAEGSTPQAVSERLLESVASWRGRSRDDPQDDITIIAVQFPAAEAAQVRG